MSFSLMLSQLVRGAWFIDYEAAKNYEPLVQRIIARETLTLEDEGLILKNKIASAPGFFDLSSRAIIKKDNTYENAKGLFDTAPMGSVAIIPIVGATMKYDFCGSAGTNTIQSWFLTADNHPNIAGTIFLMDTPGGSADGPKQLNSVIKNSKKPTLAYVDGLCASAGYFIGCSANLIMANSETAMIGSIGTMCTLMSRQGLQAANGIKEHNIVSDLSPDKNKAFYMAMTGDYTIIKKEVLDPLTEIFHQTVIDNRGDKMTDPKSAKEPLTGKIYLANAAIDNGLIDGIGSLSEAIDKVIALSDSNYKLKLAA